MIDFFLLWIHIPFGKKAIKYLDTTNAYMGYYLSSTYLHMYTSNINWCPFHFDLVFEPSIH